LVAKVVMFRTVRGNITVSVVALETAAWIRQQTCERYH